MEFRRRQVLGWGVLAVCALLGGLWLLRLDYARKISSDVLDLIPGSEAAPELALVRQLASHAEAQTMLIALTDAGGRAVPLEVAQQFAAALAHDPAFADAVALADPAPRDALGKELYARRLDLLFPQWLSAREAAHAPGADFSEWLAKDAVKGLTDFLNTPTAPVFQEIVPGDPLLLVPGVVNHLQGGPDWAGAAPAGGAALVWARLAASPLSEAGQQPAFAAIERAAATVRAGWPGLRVSDTGVNRFAAASRARIEREVSWLNALSLAAVLAVAVTFIRGTVRALHLVPVVLLSILGAWVGVTLVFERVHMLVFVVGSMLTGVAIDYGFYLFMQPPAYPGEDYPEKVRRLAKPLLASCLTTVAGFALLLFSPLPLIRQLGLFVGAGLVSALGAAVVYFATVRRPFLEARAWRWPWTLLAGGRRGLRRVLTVAWLAALPGLALLKWKDDIRQLEIPAPEVQQEDARIRRLFGDGGERTVYLTYGENLPAARAALEKFAGWLQQAGGGRARSFSLATVLPTPAEYAHAREFARANPEFIAAFRRELEAAGYEVAEFAPFFTAWEQFRAAPADGWAEAVAALRAKATGPLGLLLHDGRPMAWMVTVVTDAPAAAPPEELHTVSASQLQTLNNVLARYRASALWLSLIGLGIVGGGVLLSYGWRDGVRIFAIPCGTCLGLFGLLGWLGVPLNLFHLLGAFLGVCLTHNYSIFTATSAYRGEPPPISVRVSGLTTMASFGVLALSAIPVVQALGLTVALMVAAALLTIEFEHLSGLGGKR
ncbi:MAG: MMPL family transporter [Verrucomicrobia bacterium]|nr:MMPL family transporter [Verrucomicrobiota bacterium]